MSYAKEIAQAKDKMEILKKQSHYEPLALDELVFHPENHYPIDADALSQLADDIERNGLLHNLVVSCRADGVTVVLSGERRLRALQMLRNRNPESGVWDFAQCLIYQDLTHGRNSSSWMPRICRQEVAARTNPPSAKP